ncbi:hypothetical protein LOD99_3886 [Oopsacas minuta]|uniref:Uncharacterized protein n=1 Tax=Oopsacas minuta TaxID=111878 RepID=A0AAV7JXM0_9METZ|nr:hypothetical protein LOD99_3886 [Oopsacas minuta]
MLRDWTKGKRKGQPFAIPMAWREPQDQTTDCYFCMANTKVLARRADKRFLIIVYHQLYDLSRILIDFLLRSLVVLLFLMMKELNWKREDIVEMEYQKKDTKSESKDSSCETRVTVQQFNQSELNDLVRDLDLSKQAAELLTSRLKEKQLQDRSVMVSFFRKREELLLPYFSVENKLVYCDDIPGPLGQLDISSYDPGE